MPKARQGRQRQGGHGTTGGTRAARHRGSSQGRQRQGKDEARGAFSALGSRRATPRRGCPAQPRRECPTDGLNSASSHDVERRRRPRGGWRRGGAQQHADLFMSSALKAHLVGSCNEHTTSVTAETLDRGVERAALARNKRDAQTNRHRKPLKTSSQSRYDGFEV